MPQSALMRDGQPVDAALISADEWELLKITAKLGDFVMTCCHAPAALKTSPNGLHFFSHVTDECNAAPETVWHKAGKAAIIAALNTMGIEGGVEVPGNAPNGENWEADVLFSVGDRTIEVELQRSYQNFRDFVCRQERYTASSVECYWLVRPENFPAINKAAMRIRLEREFGGVLPAGGLFAMLPELPVAILDIEDPQSVQFVGAQKATVPLWLNGIISGSYQYRDGRWNLG